ncbi:HAAS signaling domain-containing protein [Cytobacillus pseudoceanisediminis]|uniref:HAAS signaling domain-containing protein n=1 Tax=Cytobacillus pseudoceanisediminis TaxID=3051614 RepID=UPI003C2D8D64
MDLIEVYIQEVTRRLPEKSRADIALELQSTIRDMLPDDYNEEEVKDVLSKLGSPAALAAGYRDQPMHLIGPRYFDVYVSLLKMILPIAAAIALISVAAEFIFDFHRDDTIINMVLGFMGYGVWRLIEVAIQVFFWLTIVFAVIERMDKGKEQHPLSPSLKPWTPDDLKSITYIPKKKAISKCEVFGSLMWTAIWATLYFYADRLMGVYRGGGEGLEFQIAAVNQEVLLGYWPIVVVIIALEVGLALYKLIIGQWTKRMAIFNTVLELFATIVFIFILLNPNLLQPEFTAYMSDLFSISAAQFKSWLLGGIMIVFIFYAGMSIFDGIRKSRIQ